MMIYRRQTARRQRGLYNLAFVVLHAADSRRSFESWADRFAERNDDADTSVDDDGRRYHVHRHEQKHEESFTKPSSYWLRFVVAVAYVCVNNVGFTSDISFIQFTASPSSSANIQ